MVPRHQREPEHLRARRHGCLPTASLELGCKETGCEFVSWLDILQHEDCPAATQVAHNPLVIPYRLDGKERHVIPDALCGIEHAGGVNYFALEADRKNEPIETHDLKRSSYAGHIAGYRRILRQELYRKRYGIENLQIMNVTVSTLHMLKVIKYLDRETKQPHRDLTGPRPVVFKAVPELGRRINTPPISGHILTSPWQRVGEADVSLYK